MLVGGRKLGQDGTSIRRRGFNGKDQSQHYVLCRLYAIPVIDGHQRLSGGGFFFFSSSLASSHDIVMTILQTLSNRVVR